MSVWLPVVLILLQGVSAYYGVLIVLFALSAIVGISLIVISAQSNRERKLADAIITGDNAYCYFIPSPPLNGVGLQWQLWIGNTGNVDLPSCDYQLYEIPQSTDNSPEVDRKLDLRVHSFGRVLRGTHSTDILLQAGPNKRYRLILRTPMREVQENIDFTADPKTPTGYKPECKILTPGEKILLDSCDMKPRP
jgi:hypothetical protein